MTFEEWWATRYGADPIPPGVWGRVATNDPEAIAAALAWDAATAAERERIARLVEDPETARAVEQLDYIMDHPVPNVEDTLSVLAARIRAGANPSQ